MTAMPARQTPLAIHVSEDIGDVSGLLERPEGDARALYVLAHGAGAGMLHRFMTSVAQLLHARGVATLRYQFPYTERGGRRPDPPKRLLATIAAAVEAGADAMPGTPIFAGGKSMGGRMTSQLAAAAAPEVLRGLVYLGFPLHPPGKEGTQRAAHLPSITLPMLFIQGTRDKLADMTLMEEVMAGLPPTARMHVVEGADHSFGVLKRSGRTPEAVLAEIADATADFIAATVGVP
ncbi:MAG: alpha/beta family hydrolase [Myxococcota bacterium]